MSTPTGSTARRSRPPRADRDALETTARTVGLDGTTLAQLTSRAGSPDYERWEHQVRRAGACSHPIRLKGVVTEGGQVTYDTRTEPDGVLLKRCGNRRAAVCPSCSYEYRGDAYQLVRAGIVGGKGIPTSVARHPTAFVTLTAPSFGPVHGYRNGKPCRPRREGGLCPHGRPQWCMRRHGHDDPANGTPLCPDCYDYQSHVLFQWWAPELWRRFTVALHRQLASQLNLTEKAFRAKVRVQYGKVAEFQKRGVVHVHALVRLDANTGPDGDHQPPPFTITADALADAVKAAADHVRYTANALDNQAVVLRWGQQVDVRAVNTGLPDELTGEVVAAYISKYQTKATEDLGLGSRPITSTMATTFGLHPHHVAIITAIERLAAAIPDLARALRWTHMLGFRGHCFTKSRRYSTTFGRLRTARANYRRRQEREALELAPDDEDDDTTLVISTWTYAGRGYTNNGDALLASSIAAWTREARDLGREVADLDYMSGPAGGSGRFG